MDHTVTYRTGEGVFLPQELSLALQADHGNGRWLFPCLLEFPLRTDGSRSVDGLQLKTKTKKRVYVFRWRILFDNGAV